jgi:hypothetical protein
VNSFALSGNAVLLSLLVENKRAEEALVSIAVGSHLPSTEVIATGHHGFSVYPSAPPRESALTFITGDYPLVTNASTFWFGDGNAIQSSLFRPLEVATQLSDNSGIAFSWHKLQVSAGGSIRKAIIVRSGLFYPTHVTLTLSCSNPAYVASPEAALNIVVRAESDPASSYSSFRLFLVIDNNESNLTEFPGEYAFGPDHTITFIPASYLLTNGTHSLSIHAVSAIGDVSAAQSTTIIFGNDPNTGTTPSKSSSAGVIAGAVVGGIVGICLIVGLIIFLVRKKSNADGSSGAEQRGNTAVSP